jgi:hypothetical protein
VYLDLIHELRRTLLHSKADSMCQSAARMLSTMILDSRNARLIDAGSYDSISTNSYIATTVYLDLIHELRLTLLLSKADSMCQSAARMLSTMIADSTNARLVDAGSYNSISTNSYIATTMYVDLIHELRLTLLLSKADSRSQSAARMLSTMITDSRNVRLVDAGSYGSISIS